LHPGEQSGGTQPQKLRGSASVFDFPTGLLQHREKVLALATSHFYLGAGYALWPGFGLQQCRRRNRGPAQRSYGKKQYHRDENRSVSKIVPAQKGRMRLNVKEQIRSAHWECDGTAVFGSDDCPIHQGLVGHFGQAFG